MESTKVLEDEFAKFEDWYKAIIFDKNCNIIAKKNCDKLKDGELKEFLTSFDDRDTTIGKGFMFCGYHFDAHRFHPPLTYGRRGGPEGGPEDAEGIWPLGRSAGQPHGDQGGISAPGEAPAGEHQGAQHRLQLARRRDQ